MQNFFKNWYQKWRELLKDKKFRISLFVGLGLLGLAFYINFQAAFYTDSIPVLSVGDLILDHIPTIDLSPMFTFGIYFTAMIVVFYPLLFQPELVPFMAKTAATFVITRAFFISLTHLGAPADFFRLPGLEDQAGFSKFFYMNDLFFSGHTGFPFLAALVFWENKVLRYFMLAMSIGQSITVLFMHVHYSIDVFAAYFITYTIYALADKLFNQLNFSFRKIVERLRNMAP